MRFREPFAEARPRQGRGVGVEVPLEGVRGGVSYRPCRSCKEKGERRVIFRLDKDGLFIGRDQGRRFGKVGREVVAFCRFRSMLLIIALVRVTGFNRIQQFHVRTTESADRCFIWYGILSYTSALGK